MYSVRKQNNGNSPVFVAALVYREEKKALRTKKTGLTELTTLLDGLFVVGGQNGFFLTEAGWIENERNLGAGNCVVRRWSHPSLPDCCVGLCQAT